MGFDVLQPGQNVLAVDRQKPLAAGHNSRLWGLREVHRQQSRALEEGHTLRGVPCHTMQPLLCVVLPQLFEDTRWAVTQAPLPQQPDYADVTGVPW